MNSHTISLDNDRICGGLYAGFQFQICFAEYLGDRGLHIIGSSNISINRLHVELIGGDGIFIEEPPAEVQGLMRIAGLLDASGSVIVTPAPVDDFAPIDAPPDRRLDPGRAVIVRENLGNGVVIQNGASDISLVGLRVTSNRGHGVMMDDPGENIRIEESLIGGPDHLTGGFNDGDGVHIQDAIAGDLFIGAPKRGNNIGANGEWGVAMFDSQGITVQANSITHNGLPSIEEVAGILIQECADILVGGQNPADRNLVSANQSNGIEVVGAMDIPGGFIEIKRNFIGTLFGGNGALANGLFGIKLDAGITPELGDRIRATRNLVSGNTAGGMWIRNWTMGPRVDDNVVGVIPLAGGVPNSGPGIFVDNSNLCRFFENDVGINNGDGFFFSQASNNRVTDELITGQTGNGIVFDNGSRGNVVANCLITQNGDAGVLVTGGSVRNTITAARITANGGKGIDLRGGGNNNIPAPVIRQAVMDNQGNYTFVGEVAQSVPDGSLVELSADPDDEGEVGVAFGITVNNSFSFSPVAPPPGTSYAGKNFTATVTDLSGNTSEYGILDPLATLGRGEPEICVVPPDPAFDFYVSSERGGEIALTNIAYCTTMISITDTVPVGYPGVNGSLNDAIIIYTREAAGQSEIYVASGGTRVNLTNSPTNDSQGSLSPDGTKVAFVSDRFGDNEVCVVNVDGSSLNRLTNNPANDREPSWSPDCSQVVFVSDRGGGDDLYTINVNKGAAAVALTTLQGNISNPAWGKLEDQVAFQLCPDGEACHIAVVDVPTGTVTNLPNEGWDDTQPEWLVTDEGEPYLIISSERPDSPGLYHLYLLSPEGHLLWQITPDSVSDRHPACCLDP